jgi:hypothetical protein|tara:strand:+ start:2379 stop:2864 length:486 start_codon:yes stop_codon:yes gene_type:complete
MKKASRRVTFTVEYDPSLVLEKDILPIFKRYDGDKIHIIKGVNDMYQHCKNCHELKNEKEYNLQGGFDQYGRKKLRNECRKCQNENDRILTLLKKENGPPSENCHLCGKEKKLFLDHCHKTNKFRGWLCNDCNSGLGKLGDDIPSLERGIKYLKGEINDKD